MNTPPASRPATGTFQPLNSIWQHKVLVVLVAVIIATGGTYIAWIKGTPVYQATAVIYVAPRFASILAQDKELEFQSYTQYQQFIKQQTRTINRYDIVLEALNRLGERRFALWQRAGESDRKAAERLQGALMIRDVRDTYLITVALQSENPTGLHEIVNGVIQVYLEQTSREDIYASGERIEILLDRRRERLARIAALVERRNELTQTLGVTTFADGMPNPYDTLLVESRAAQLDAERRRITAEAELGAYDEAVGGKEAHQALLAAVGELVSKDPGLNSLKANLYKRRSELLEETTGLAPSHPVRRKAERELDDLEAEVERATTALAEEKAAMLLEHRRARVRETRAVEAVLSRQVQGQKTEAIWFATHYNEAVELTASIARERAQLDIIDDRIDFLELESNAPGFIRISNWAMQPIEPISGGRTRLAVLFAAFGGLLGLAAAIGIDLIDRRVLTTRQAESLLGFRPLAAFLAPSEDPARRALATDQMRRLAITLGREKTKTNLHRLFVTSARHGCGATTIVFDLALELRRQGLRVLVIEANPLNPDTRYLASSSALGLTELLDNEEPNLAAAIVLGDESMPDRVATGPNATGHLGEYGRLPAVLEQACAEYDLVLIDAAPIRLSADSEFLAGLCDLALLVVRARYTLIGELKGSAARLEKAAPPTVGLIMTGLPIFRGGGYYAQVILEYARVIDKAKGRPPTMESR